MFSKNINSCTASTTYAVREDFFGLFNVVRLKKQFINTQMQKYKSKNIYIYIFALCSTLV